MEIGAFEILAVAAIALLFFGPSKLPQMGKSVGEAIRGFKKGMSEMQDSMNDEPKRDTNRDVNRTANQSPRPESSAQNPVTPAQLSLEDVAPGASVPPTKTSVGKPNDG